MATKSKSKKVSKSKGLVKCEGSQVPPRLDGIAAIRKANKDEGYDKESKSECQGTEASLEACLASVVEACRSSELDRDEDPTKLETQLAHLKFNIISLSTEVEWLRQRLNSVRGEDICSKGECDEDGERRIHSPVVELLLTANDSLSSLRDEIRDLKYSLEV